MGLQTTNNYLLLKQVVDVSSQFVAEGNDGDHFTVAFSNSEQFKVGAEVYVLDTLGVVKIDGKDYTVASDSEVVAYVA